MRFVVTALPERMPAVQPIQCSPAADAKRHSRAGLERGYVTLIFPLISAGFCV
jgi:hypothetical protein